MDLETYQAFQELAHSRAGISLRPGNSALVQARLARRLRELGIASEREYLARLRGAEGNEEIVFFLDAISTNFTRFFREPDHFDALAGHVRTLRSAGQRRFRFWSAACSSGEEPYTAAMVLDPLLEGCDWEILATDISTRMLSRAADALYSDAEIEPVAEPLRSRYLKASAPGGDGAARWVVEAKLRERITFQRLNLAARPYPMSGPLDAVFCRNVMIYFDRPMREGLVQELERLLRPGSPLFVGHSETLVGIPTRLRSERPSIYRLPAGAR